MGGGEAADPDYRTLWPQMEVASVRPPTACCWCEIAGDAFTERPDGMTQRDAGLAIQQLVYTLQGVQQERVPVRCSGVTAATPLFGLSTDHAVHPG